ncbi:hypothetical protein BDV33DRAFT_208102 [Aspergillus novoparasiticus]|uniref:Uncharacterized protein n=1 Tax=Aspergillus novoparasiticus TaxID=986946 RepID=A0A5N6EDH2_9EURO|nr:hypothetical protein BDV33DRAFT_208102 [Aspergillus novoparasiticus]
MQPQSVIKAGGLRNCPVTAMKTSARQYQKVFPLHFAEAFADNPYDPAIPITTEQIPPEYNHPQTAQFRELTDIENKFHLSNEEREARIVAGPRPVESRQNFSRHPRRYGGYGGYGLYMVEGALEMVEVVAAAGDADADKQR